MTEYCEVEGCKRPIAYTVEWWGLNQFGKNPIVEREADVCSDMSHIYHIFHWDDDDFGKADNIVEINTYEDLGDLTNFVKTIQRRTQLEFSF